MFVDSTIQEPSKDTKHVIMGSKCDPAKIVKLRNVTRNLVQIALILWALGDP